MQRRNFLIRISAGAAAALSAASLVGCLSQSENPQNTPVDFVLDLSQLPQLNKTGGFLIRDNVLVAKTIQRDFVAATVICSHEQQRKMLYDDDKNQFHCTAHDARFDATGKGLNNNGKRNLTIYNTQLNGNDLRVFS